MTWLLLARKASETVIIGDGENRITIKVMEFQCWNGQRKVRLGIDAPRDISVHRGEVQEEIDARGRPSDD